MKPSKKSIPARLAAAAFWLALWQWAAMAVGQEVFLVSPLRALDTLVRLLPTADFWGRVAFPAGGSWGDLRWDAGAARPWRRRRGCPARWSCCWTPSCSW